MATVIKSMSISDLKLELMELNDPSFVFNQRDELECALRSRRRIEYSKMKTIGLNINNEKNDGSDDNVVGGVMHDVAGCSISNNDEDKTIPDLATVSSSGGSTSVSTAVRCRPQAHARGSRDKDTSARTTGGNGSGSGSGSGKSSSKPPRGSGSPSTLSKRDKDNNKKPNRRATPEDIFAQDEQTPESTTTASRRLVEYFVMVSCVPIIDTVALASAISTKAKMRPPLDPTKDKMNSRTKARFDVRRVHLVQQQQQSFSSSNTDAEISSTLLEPQITARYPPTDHVDQPLNPRLSQFCHPEGNTEIISPTTEYKMPRVHHFVLTDCMGGKLYGTALTVYEEFHGGDSSNVKEGEEESTASNDSSSKKKKKGGKTYYAPRVLTLLSTYPYLTSFRTYLTQLYRLATTTNCMTSPIERYVQNICMEVPAPPAGAFEVELCIHPSLGSGCSHVTFWAPPADQPIAYVSLPFQVLFECLDIGNILFAWYTLACERKVLLVSSQLSLLTVCSEILCSLLFPMKWSHLYIPVLPRALSPMLDAPMPYLCGVSRENFGYAVEDISDETIVVDLDRNVITLGGDTPELPPLPHNRRKKLEATLKASVGDVFWEARNLRKAEVLKVRASGDESMLSNMLDSAGQVWEEKIQTRDDAFNLAHAPDSVSMQLDEGVNDDIANGTTPKQSKWDAVQEAFLRFYVSVLQDYRKFLPKEGNMEERSTWRGKEGMSSLRFNKEEFVAAAPSEFQPFLEELTISQQFDDFVTRKMHNASDAPDIKFFDQSIEAKKNRSKLKLVKKETPFLHSACAHRELKRIKAVEPNSDDLPPKEDGDAYIYKMWPVVFDEKLFGTPRPIPSIISAEFDRRNALKSMLRSKKGNADGFNGRNKSLESTAFILFFASFTSIIGKELAAVEEKHASDNSSDDLPQPVSPLSRKKSLANLDDDIEVARTIAKAQIDLAYHTLSLMRARKLPPEPIAYKLLIQACGQCKVTHRASSIMDMLTREGLATNSEIYTGLITAFSSGEESRPSHLSLYHNRDDSLSALSESNRDGSSTTGLLRTGSSFDRKTNSNTPSESEGSYNESFVNSLDKKKKSRFSLRKNRYKMRSPKTMSKKQSLKVTAVVSKHIELGESLLESLYPSIDIDNQNTCPKCTKTVDEDYIYSGWTHSNEYETICPSCKHCFVPKFSVTCSSPTFEGSQGKGTPLYCDNLSPWVVLREIRSIIAATRGIDSILKENFRTGINSTLWWNMVVIFRRYKLPFTFLLQGSFRNNVILSSLVEEEAE